MKWLMRGYRQLGRGEHMGLMVEGRGGTEKLLDISAHFLSTVKIK